MKRLLCIVAVLLAGCAGVKPPERPVAYLVPSLVPYSVMTRCVPHKATAQDVRGLLAKAGLLDGLLEAGMRKLELAIVARGLSGKGYAEIDCRKSRSAIRWVALFYDGKAYVIRSGIARSPKGTVQEKVVRLKVGEW